ncbi:hypothetical protein V8C86DRAFT_2460598 [Haematococcus lacustris]
MIVSSRVKARPQQPLNRQRCESKTVRRCSRESHSAPVYDAAAAQLAWDTQQGSTSRQLAIANLWGTYKLKGKLAPAVSHKLLTTQDKNRLPPELRSELARRLREETWQEHCLLPADGHQVGVLRLFRYALDDLRLFQAIAEAGMLGRIVVSDQLAEAHVVVATRITRTGHDAPLKAVRRTAAKAGLPYVELEKVSGLRIMQALAPLMGIPVPCHLLRRKQPLMPVLSKAWPARPELASEEEEAQGKEDQLQPAAVLSVKRQANRCARANDVAQLHIASRPVRSAVTTPLLKAGLLLEPDVDDLDVQDDRQWMRPSNPKDVLGARRQLVKPLMHGSQQQRKRRQLIARDERVPF